MVYPHLFTPRPSTTVTSHASTQTSVHAPPPFPPSCAPQETVFSTVGGLRGGLALILVQTVVAAHSSTDTSQLKVWQQVVLAS
jgi:hypothetical protein